MKICIVRLGGMGDILLSTPTARALFEHYKTKEKTVEIDYVVGPGMAPALEGIPYVRRVFVLEPEFKSLRTLAPRLAQEQYDLYINLQPYLRTTLLGWAMRPKQTIRFRKDQKKQPDTGKVRHAIDDFSKEVAALGITVTNRQMDFAVPDTARKSLKKQFAPAKPYICLNPGASHAVNRWPEEKFAALLGQLNATFPQYEYVLVGGKEDAERARNIAAQASISVTNLAGQLNIKEFGALLEKSVLLVTADTGPLHIASALKTPLVTLFGAANPDRTGPSNNPRDLVVINPNLTCIPCSSRTCQRKERDTACMTQLDTEWVLDAIRRRLEGEIAPPVHPSLRVGTR
jgi:lipopolysaccharide heptosyltransferase II